MPNRQDRRVITPRSPFPRLSATSYVYPVKSLLEGRIQPAGDAYIEKPPLKSRSSDDITGFFDKREPSDVFSSGPSEVTGTIHQNSPAGVQADTTALPQKSRHSRRRAASVTSPSLTEEDGSTDLETQRRKSGKKRASTSNYSHFPAGYNPSFPRTFSSANNTSESSSGSSTRHAIEPSPLGLSSDQVLGNQIYDIFHGRREPPLSYFATEALSMKSSSLMPQSSHEHDMLRATPLDSSSDTFLMVDAPESGPPEDTQPLLKENKQNAPALEQPLPTFMPPSHESDPLATPVASLPAGSYQDDAEEDEEADLHHLMPFNPSEYGLVHLPPISNSSTNSDRWSSSMSNGSGNMSRNSNPGRISSRGKNPSSTTGTGSPAASGRRLRSPANDGCRTSSSGQSQVLSSENGSSFASEDYPTFRFRSTEDENGNFIVVGREGMLQNCEDEPIRTPGAVQGFGVLIAVDEIEDTLVVRQVSENSTELLGLPPRYLFGLKCFTDTLPESQVGLLWDNIEFLAEPDSHSEEEESSPHVFLLSGFGAPGSGQSHEPDTMDGRRMWTCWCAVHRVQAEDPKALGLMVMEFELERDVLNPLYPASVPQQSSALTSSFSRQANSSPENIDPSAYDHRENSNSPVGTIGSASESSESTAGNPSSAVSSTPSLLSTRSATASQPIVTPPSGLLGDEEWIPCAEDIIESTTSRSRPLPALERLRRMTRGETPYGSIGDSGTEASTTGRRDRRRATRGSSAVGMMDVFAVMAQINEQLGATSDLDSFLKVVVGVIKDLTQFHRVMIYQFDEAWNGQVVAELVDWNQSHDLFRGLHFPATDIPTQARELYAINKVRLLYDCKLPTARITVRNRKDLDTPLNMTHCYLRAMSPIHIQYLENMGVRASMSVSVMAFGQLWGLVTCHSYGFNGMRVSFPVRQMLRLLSQSISKNIERLSYAQRLHTRKLINTMATDNHPTGYIVSNADDLLGLFDADFGILVIGEGAKILGPNQHGQEILIMAEYLRLKQYDTIQASQAVVKDFPDLDLTTGFEIIAGLLYVPLSSGGKDFIVFLRRGQPRQVHWAGKPYKDGHEQSSKLEPRKSFKVWSETVAGRSRLWTDEQLETAGVLALVYGKFIEVWREKENALQTTKLTNLLLSNASHEVRTPLNHIINYLEMAMNGTLDVETRDNLRKSHAASKSLLFTINDLLDLTRLESGNETSFNEPFDLHFAIEESTHLYRKEAERRNINFTLELKESPAIVIGDVKKIRTVVQNLTANALKYTSEGTIKVSCTTFSEPEGLRSTNQTVIEILVADTGCGIAPDKLENIFREFEQVESSEPRSNSKAGVGLGLAVVARIVEQLGGQLRVESTVGKGSQFSLLIPLSLNIGRSSSQGPSSLSSGSSRGSPVGRSLTTSRMSGRSPGHNIDSLVSALSSNHMASPSRENLRSNIEEARVAEGMFHPLPSTHRRPSSHGGIFDIPGSVPVRPIKIDAYDVDVPLGSTKSPANSLRIEGRTSTGLISQAPQTSQHVRYRADLGALRVLIVEDNDINRTILAKRLTLNGHAVFNTTNGQEGLDKVVEDPSFDVVLMDIQMPILTGFEATRGIRDFEKSQDSNLSGSNRRLSCTLNGRIPIFAVSASLLEQQREELAEHGFDGWILKPIDFKRLNVILRGVTDASQRHKDVYHAGCSWELGGWLKRVSDPPS